MAQKTVLSLSEIYQPIEQYLPQVEEKILEILATPNELSGDVIRYFFKSKGKQLRPALVLFGARFGKTGSPAVIIAVLDTGIDLNHPDLVANLVPGWNVFDGNTNTNDVLGHGTRTAGTTAAVGNNSLGIRSIAWSSAIMPIRISDPAGFASYTTIANGLIWAADHGARVANISYEVTSGLTAAAAAQYFESFGGVIIAAAGNNAVFDSAIDNPDVLTVSATTNTDSFATWSNRGNTIDISAPGVIIYTTSYGNNYTSVTGTSFSAPIVAGVAALVKSVNSGLSAQQIQCVIKLSADDLGDSGWDPLYGWGRVNAARAITYAQVPNPTSSCLNPGVPSATLTISSPSVTNKTATSATISWTTNIPSTDTVYYGTSKNNLNQVLNDTTQTTNHSVILTNLSAKTAYYYQIKAVANYGEVTTTSRVSGFRTRAK